MNRAAVAVGAALLVALMFVALLVIGHRDEQQYRRRACTAGDLAACTEAGR